MWHFDMEPCEQSRAWTQQEGVSDVGQTAVVGQASLRSRT